jgi:hypothetical protein
MRHCNPTAARLVRAQAQASAHSLDPFLSALRSGFTVIFLTSDVFWNLAQEALPHFAGGGRAPRQILQIVPALLPARRWARVRFRSSVGNGIGVPTAGSLLSYFCRRMPRVILLVFVLVSAAIDDKSCFKFKWLWL